jgi:AmiR/NasT family two-component response regulator
LGVLRDYVVDQLAGSKPMRGGSASQADVRPSPALQLRQGPQNSTHPAHSYLCRVDDLLSRDERLADKPVIALVFPGPGDDASLGEALDENAQAILVVAAGDQTTPLHEVVKLQVRRHRELLAQLAASESRLDERVIIERAKGALMQRHRVDEAGAYRLIRRSAMNSGRRVLDIAKGILSEIQSR